MGKKVIILENEIIKISFIGIKRRILLSEIKTVNFNKLTLELKLNDRKKTISCHQHLIGFEKILMLLENQGFENPLLKLNKK
jgi:hypothetical protein